MYSIWNKKYTVIYLAYFDLFRSACHTNNMLLTTDQKLQFQPHNFATLFANVCWNYGFRKNRTVELCW